MLANLKLSQRGTLDRLRRNHELESLAVQARYERPGRRHDARPDARGPADQHAQPLRRGHLRQVGLKQAVTPRHGPRRYTQDFAKKGGYRQGRGPATRALRNARTGLSEIEVGVS